MPVNDKPVVGLCLICHGDGFAHSCFADVVLPRWVKLLKDAGALPTIGLPLERSADVTRQLDQADAFIYIGWQDLNPDTNEYGPEAAEHNPEVLMIRMIAERQKPFLGIGRGMQLLNVALGGSLRSVLRGNGLGQRHVYPHNPQHPLETAPDSLIDRVYRRSSELVNSMHEFAVDEPAVGFRVTAHGPAGVVEAIERDADRWLAVGIQFHPDPYATDLDLRLLAAFLHDARAQLPQPACS
jgi:gamma-glutamyl-gamma-aminobutyrate hydrolase PuuD